jgi:hypothetical protein
MIINNRSNMFAVAAWNSLFAFSVPYSTVKENKQVPIKTPSMAVAADRPASLIGMQMFFINQHFDVFVSSMSRVMALRQTSEKPTVLKIKNTWIDMGSEKIKNN